MHSHRDEIFRGTTLIPRTYNFWALTLRNVQKRHILLSVPLQQPNSDMQLRREIQVLSFLKGTYSQWTPLSVSSADFT